MKRNKHAGVMKQVLSIQEDLKRERKLEEHKRVGKCLKKDIQKQENKLDELENQLVLEILKLPNKTDTQSPVGDESQNRLIK